MAEKRSQGNVDLLLRWLPDKIKEAPELMPGLELYYEAFTELSNTRPITQGGLGAIPWTAINEWAKRYDIEGSDFERLATYVRSLDAEYIKYVSKKNKS